MTITIRLPCACASLRRAARAISQLYDDALRGVGLRGSQFTLLQALDLAGPLTQGQLGHILAIDSTTLSRTLRGLAAENLILITPGADRRERVLTLSEAGAARLSEARPHWEQVQAMLHRRLGEAEWQTLFASADSVTSAVQAA